jgi:hypothetical protein
MSPSPILTLEPLIDAVQAGVAAVGWELSGLQKTTSHQFEGRWEGESTRSAYVFFHPPGGPDWVSVDVYLDETSRGITGNLALVTDLRALGGLEPADELLAALSRLFAEHAPARYRRPVTLRYRMDDADEGVDVADTEVRFKLRIPRSTLKEGEEAVSSMVVEAMHAFQHVLASDWLQERAFDDGDDGA